MTLIIGVLVSLSFFAKEDGTGIYHQRGILSVIITSILTICLTIIATAKFWYTHLWKKNSTHARHHKHSQHHPAVRERQFREQRHHQKR